MNTQQLLQIINSDAFIKSKCAGVYALNELPSQVVPDTFFICNTDPNWLPGRHWIVLYFTIGGSAEYFDSFGRFPKQKIIENFLDNNSTSWTYNNVKIQGTFSNTCSEYCMFYVIYRLRGFYMSTIMNMFNKNCNENDLSVYTYIRNKYPFVFNTSKKSGQISIPMYV
jgi:hypothetical protein